MSAPALVAFAGLPGAGKTTLARMAARRLGAAYLRIDVIEHALRCAGVSAGEPGQEGYAVGCALAESNLLAGLSVVADSVNPVAASRDGWRDAAAAAGATLIDVEVVCSDPAEHRLRVEGRAADLPGFVLPTWGAVTRHEYEAWDRPRLVVDTAGRDAEAALAELLPRIEAARGG